MSLYIGLMSGTSMDAVDAALVSHAEHPPRIIARHSHPIPDSLRRDLSTVVGGDYDASAVWRLDAQLGVLFAEAVEALLESAGTAASEVTAIGSHGQTVYHGPDDVPPVSVQIADPNTIVERTGITTVADFRRRDIAAGGQGAPLAPAFHQAIFQTSDRARAVVNIGGIANVTVLPKARGSTVTGFDTGPGNTLMDSWCAKHRDQPMDKDGRLAAAGSVNDSLLNALLSEPYFSRPPPKSTGREYFNLTWLDRKAGGAGLGNLSAADVQCTLAELTAATIADAVIDHAPDTEEVLVCGGGVHNPVVMEALARRMEGRTVSSTADAGADPEWIEAVAFSWMAKQTLEGRASSLPSVTGARRSVILGAVYQA